MNAKIRISLNKAQAVTEYTLFIFVIVVVVITVGVILRNKLTQFVNGYGKNFIESVFNPRSMHTKYLPRR